MRKNWLNANVDLTLLTERIGDFFKANDFEAIKGETNRGYEILAQDSSRYKFSGYISIKIQGDPKEFFIELEPGGKTKNKDFLYPIMTTTLFGGGYFLSRSLKSREELMRFEKDFWEHVDRVIEYLRNTSK